MPSRLDNLVVTEVSGVDKAANRKTFHLTKADTALPVTIDVGPLEKAIDGLKTWFAKMYGDDAKEGAKTFDESLAANTAWELEWKIQDALRPLTNALCDSVASILLDPATTEKRPPIATTLVQFLDALQVKIPLSVDQVIKVNALADPLAKLEPVIKAGAKVSGQRLKTLNQIKDLVTTLIEEVTPQAAEADPMKKEGSMPAPEAPAATVPETVTKADYDAKIAEIQKASDEKNAALQKSVDEARASVEVEKNKRETAEFIEKAAAYPNLAISKNDLGELLKDLNDALNKGVTETVNKNAEGVEVKKNAASILAKVESLLKASDEAIKAGGLFKELGRPGNGASDSLGKLEGLAKALQVANPSLTKEAAFTKAVDQNPELYSAYQTEKGAK